MKHTINKLLYKPKPDFSIFDNVSIDDLKRQHDELVSRIKNFDKAFIPEIDEKSLLFESPQEINEEKRALPHDAFVNEIKKKYSLFTGQILKKEYYNGVGIYMILYKDKSIEKMIDIDMRKKGYFLSYSTQDAYTTYFFFEPIEQADISDIVFKQDYIYHYTQRNRVNDIMENGLEPRHERKNYSYPPRIYFSLYENDGFAHMLRRALIEQGENPDKYYSLLKIDTSKLSRNQKFYFDAFAEKCVFTTHSVSKNTLEKVKDIKCDE